MTAVLSKPTTLPPGEYEVELERIQVGKRHRYADRDVTDLAESIEDVGLLHAITLTQSGRLVAGAHRLKAHRQLGRATIRSRVIDVSELEAELAEIDENLLMAPLTAMEEGRHFARRIAILETLGLRQGPGRPISKPHRSGGVSAKTTAQIAAERNLSPTSMRRRLEAVANLDDEVCRAIANSPVADHLKDLVELGEMEPGERQSVAATLQRNPGFTSVRAAQRFLWPERYAPAAEDAPWDDGEAADRSGRVVFRVTAELRVPNDDLRERKGRVYPREAVVAEHSMERVLPAEVRERGIPGLEEAAAVMARAIITDPGLRGDWLRIPRMAVRSAADIDAAVGFEPDVEPADEEIAQWGAVGVPL